MKKLPRAVLRTADDMRQAGPEAVKPAPTEQAVVSMTVDHTVVPMTVVATVARNPVDEARRLSQANAIVEKFANLSAVGGVIPVPLINVAGVTMIIMKMVNRLCGLYGVPYEPGRARALVIGLAAGALPTTASAVTSSTLFFLIPGVNMLGLAVSSVTASACARAVGYRFIEHFEKGANLLDFPVVDRRQSVVRRTVGV